MEKPLCLTLDEREEISSAYASAGEVAGLETGEKRSAKFWLDSVGLARNIGFPVHELRRIRSQRDHY